ncbi:MAG: Omp28-related outer membrane protein [Flavobacteriales bacterium]
MRSSLTIFSFFFLLGLFSCEKVEQPYEEKQGNDRLTGGCDSLTIPSDHPLTRNVLIEDLTAHKCGYCPGAALEAKNIQDQYPEGRVIIAGIHMGSLADTSGSGNKYNTDFRTQAGETYRTHYNITGLPKGMINRSLWSGDRVFIPSQWASKVDSLAGDSVDVTLQMAVDYDEIGKKVCVDVATRFLEPVVDTLATTVYLLEDSVIDWQKNYSPGGDPSYPSPDAENYVHEHVLRAAINGAWGETVLEGAGGGFRGKGAVLWV